jgi:aminopeptidase YwaD
LDNATGIAVLLLLAELLRDYEDERMIELVAFNGEDYYAAPGERLYVQQNEDFSTIALVINIDGAAYREGDTHFSLYECPEELAGRVRAVLTEHGLAEGPQWYQGDHSIFVMGGRPAVAITSAALGELMTEITHTPRDTPEIVDTGKIAQIARALRALL